MDYGFGHSYGHGGSPAQIYAPSTPSSPEWTIPFDETAPRAIVCEGKWRRSSAPADENFPIYMFGESDVPPCEYYLLRYVRALGALYMRLVGTSLDCFKYLEPLYNDYRKLKRQKRDGVFELVHMDELIDELLHEERVCDVILPRIQKRQVLEENNELDQRMSALDDDLDEVDDSDGEDIKDSKPKVVPDKRKSYRDLDRPRRSASPKFRRSRSPHKRKSKSPTSRRHIRDPHKPYSSSSRGHARSRSKSPSGHRHRHERDEDKHRSSHRENREDRRSGRSHKSGRSDRERDREQKGDKVERHGRSGGSREDPEIAEANALRAKLGMAPLRP